MDTQQLAQLAGAHGSFWIFVALNAAALAAIWIACKALRFFDSPPVERWKHAHEPKWVIQAGRRLRLWDPLSKAATVSAEDALDLVDSSRCFVKLRSKSALIGAAMAIGALALSVWLPAASLGLVFIAGYMGRGGWSPRLWMEARRDWNWVVAGSEIVRLTGTIRMSDDARRADQEWIRSAYRKQRNLIAMVIVLGLAWIPLSSYIVPWPSIAKWEGLAAQADELNRAQAMMLHFAYVGSRFDSQAQSVDVYGHARKVPGVLDRMEELAKTAYEDASNVTETQESFDRRHVDVKAHGQEGRLDLIAARCAELIKNPPLPSAGPLMLSEADKPVPAYGFGLPAASYIAGALASQMSSEGSFPGSSGAALVGLQVSTPVVKGGKKTPRFVGACFDVGSQDAPRVVLLMPDVKSGALYGAEQPIPFGYAREAGFVDGMKAQAGHVAGGADLVKAKLARAKEFEAQIGPSRSQPALAPKFLASGTDWSKIYQRLLKPEMP